MGRSAGSGVAREAGIVERVAVRNAVAGRVVILVERLRGGIVGTRAMGIVPVLTAGMVVRIVVDRVSVIWALRLSRR
jgi:hypothetical protein